MAQEARNTTENEAILRACTWVRVSTAEQAADGRAGLPRQRDCIAGVIAQKGYAVIREFELVDVSGSSTLQASETHELLALIEGRQIDVVLTTEMSRICRPDDLASLQVLDFCKRFGVLLDLGGTIHDFESPDGYLSGMLSGMIAGYERMTMLRRLHQACESKRARGQHPGSKISLPLGIDFDRKESKYVLTPEIAKVVEAFRMIDEGCRSFAEIGRHISVTGAGARIILSNPIYRGVRVYDEKRDVNAKGVGRNGRQKDKPKIARKPEDVIRVRVFAPEAQPISDERWHRVQDVLKSIRENHTVFVAEHHKGNLLAGTGRCGFCAERLFAKTRNRQLSNGSKHSGFYICRSHHESATRQPENRKCQQGWNRKIEMDDLAEAFVTRFLADPEFVMKVLDDAVSKQSEKIVGLDLGGGLQAQLDELKLRDQRLLASMEAGAISPVELKQRRDRLSEERKRLMSTMSRGTNAHGDDQSRAEDAATIVAKMVAWPASGTVKERKAFMQRTFSEIYFRGTTITAFRLVPGLISPNSRAWGAISEMPVSLDPPLSIKPVIVPVVVPEDHKQCSRCKTVKQATDFYGTQAACKACHNAATKERYLRKRGRLDV